MPQPVTAYTDPVNAIANVFHVPQTFTPAPPRVLLSTSRAMLQNLPPLVRLDSGVSKRSTTAALANPGAVDLGASALVTFPAIYKAYAPGGGVIPTPRYPVMREYPPIIRP